MKCTAVQRKGHRTGEEPVTGDAVHNEGAQVGSLDKVQCIGSNQGEVGVNHEKGFGSDDVRVQVEGESDVSGVQVGGGTGGSEEVSGGSAMIQDTLALLGCCKSWTVDWTMDWTLDWNLDSCSSKQRPRGVASL